MLAASMTAPLLHVAAGTRAVAEGDYRPVREFAGNDEIERAHAIVQCDDPTTRRGARRDRGQAEGAGDGTRLSGTRAHQICRLACWCWTGTAVWSPPTRRGRILGLTLSAHVGEPLAEVAPELAERIENAFADQLLARRRKTSWQQQVAVRRSGAPATAEPLALLARGSRLPLDNGTGYVVVFDDITQVISAQRALAWGEVARRLAHEIKNPLTPIQLTAERLQMKLADQLPPEQAEILVRGAATIVSQVAAMKRMVDDFRNYARVPPARLAALRSEPPDQ